MIVIDSTALMEMVFGFMIPFIRIAAFISVLPLFGSQMVPVRVRLILTIVLTLITAPMITVNLQPDLSVAMVLVVMQQILIGVSLAFVLVIFFHIFALAGQMLALQMGLGFASMIDPSNGVSVPIVSQFYTILVGLLFLTFGGHLVAIEAIVESFKVIPINEMWRFDKAAAQLITLGSWLFAAALLMALPAVVAILIVNLAFGVMTRAAPQLNIFSLGFPFTLMFGLFIIWVSMQGFLVQYEQLSVEAFSRIRQLLLTV